MLIKNKTSAFQSAAGKVARPWRVIEVPESTKVDEGIFEILEKKEIKIKKGEQ